MPYNALIVVFFLLSGEPKAFVKMLLPGQVCTEEAAVDFMKASMMKEPFQDVTLWQCLEVQSPGQSRPTLFPGQSEASQMPSLESGQ